jgi:hypothetical protein
VFLNDSRDAGKSIKRKEKGRERPPKPEGTRAAKRSVRWGRSRPFRDFSRVPFWASGLHISLVARFLGLVGAETRKENREENRFQHGFPVTFEFWPNEE